jgi:hypothetical protein
LFLFSTSRLLVTLLGMLLLCMGPKLRAAIVYSGVQDIPIATGFEGTYLNVVSGESGGSSVLGWQLNFFFGGAGIWNLADLQPVRASLDPFARVLNLDEGTLIGASSVFAVGEGGSGDLGFEHLGYGSGLFEPTLMGILGFKLDLAGEDRYGWMRVTLTADEVGAFIHDWAYDTTGAPIYAGLLTSLVPEPNRALLMALSLGALICRRRRKAAIQPVNGSLLVVAALGLLSLPSLALDQNNDGISDVFAAKVLVETGTGNPARDLDGDGASDVTEFLFGTDPKSSNSVPLYKPRHDPSGVYRLTPTMTGAKYGLETSTDLRTWTTAIEPVVATGASITFTLSPRPALRPITYARFFAPASQPDVDGDGLNVLEEAIFGTSDTQSDVDADGLNDSQEFINGTDPHVSNNTAPSVSFASSAGAQIDLGSLLSLTVTASDTDAGDSVSLSLHEGSNQIGSPVSAGSGGNFNFDLSNAAAGPHIYLAKATDSRGKSSWAAITVYVRQPPTEDETYGPIEGGMKFTVQTASSDLRSNPFLRQPLFAGAVGTVSGDTLYFNEQPGWNHGAFASGHYVYVRSGSRLGAIIRVAGNDPDTLKLESATHGLVTGDLIALVPQWTLDTMLPVESVHASTNVHVAAADFALPSADAYHHVTGTGWVLGAETTAEPVYLPPWGTFSIRHATGSGSTSLRLQGDIATGARRITIPALGSADGMTIAPIAFEAMSLNESGLKDSTFVSGGADCADIAAPGGMTLRWRLIEQQWVPASGTDDGSTLVILPGGAITIGRSAAFSTETTWLQPFGK